MTLNIPLTIGATAEVFIRIVPVSPFPIRPAVLNLNEILREVTIGTGFVWLYFGSALFLVLFQGLWWFHLREPASRDYIIFSIGMTVATLTRYGVVDNAIHRPFGFYLAEWLPHLMLLNTILALRFHLTFYNLASTIPNAARALHGFGIGLLLLLGAGIFVPPTVFFKFVLGAQMLGMLIALCIGITAARRGLPGAGIALVGWIGMYAIIFVVNLSGLGLLPKPAYMQLLPLAGILWEMVMNTLGLSRKFELMSKQRHEAEKQEIERYSLRRLVRLLCHDISNPLTAIFLSSRSFGATGGNQTPENTAAHMQRIVKASTAIREIIDSVRMLERLQLTGGRVEVAPTDLATMITETESLFQEKLQQKSLRLVKAIPPDLPLVLAEGSILKSSVLANILSNAIKFSVAGSTIELSAERNENSVTLRVRDHGVGIPPELIDEFNRSRLIRSRPGTFDEQGTGLGLQLVHGFTTAMGGRMRLLSGHDQNLAGEGGTIVEIILPAAPPVAALKT
jgi:signal transduction histidine kinase